METVLDQQEVLFIYKTRVQTCEEAQIEGREINLHHNFQPLRKYRGDLFTQCNLNVTCTVKTSRSRH